MGVNIFFRRRYAKLYIRLRSKASRDFLVLLFFFARFRNAGTILHHFAVAAFGSSGAPQKKPEDNNSGLKAEGRVPIFLMKLYPFLINMELF